MAVVTSSVPVGGDVVDSGGGSAVRARFVDSASDGAPARTGRGLRALALGSGAAAFCLAAAARVADFARALGAALALGFGFGLVAGAVVPPPSCRSAPSRVARVAGRLPRTVSSSGFSLIADQSTFRTPTRGHSGTRMRETPRAARRREDRGGLHPWTHQDGAPRLRPS